MSDFVVHFTRGGANTNDYGTMMSIYYGRRLEAKNAFGIGRSRCPNLGFQKAVCFSEIPPGEWKRLGERRGTKYGIAFKKQFLISRGGGPIWYNWKETPHWKVLDQLMMEGQNKPDSKIWSLTPFIDSPGEYGGNSYYFEWEREWRHIGDLKFEPEDVSFLLLPENFHDSARSFFESAVADNLGPGYFCPYIDPSWNRKTILDSLSKVITQCEIKC